VKGRCLLPHNTKKLRLYLYTSEFGAPKEIVLGCLNYESRYVSPTRHTDAKKICSAVPGDKFRQSVDPRLKRREESLS
jgi:hypothetical protein